MDLIELISFQTFPSLKFQPFSKQGKTYLDRELNGTEISQGLNFLSFFF